jgi:acetyltransferase
MSTRHLNQLFSPTSIAVIGASNRPRSVGSVVMHNLLGGGFSGPILPVNPRHASVAGVLAYPNIAALPLCPDLAVLCTPPTTIPGLISEIGERGTRAVVVMTAGLSEATDDRGRSVNGLMLEAARPHRLRILGPNCVGVLVPLAGLNASFSHVAALPGRIAFVSQSGAFCTVVLDWARARGIGFSHFISLGNIADIDFGDVLDFLGSEPQTTAILLYIESIGRDASRKFMSAARAAARNKSVLVIKSGRFAEGARAAASHTGALAGADDVYDAAFQRAGMLRVYEIDEIFEAVETLGRARRLRGDRLVILTNGGGPGVTATDALIGGGGRLADLAPETIARLNKILPATWSGGNPVDIIGDATEQRYTDALGILAEDPNTDAVLVMNAPTAIASTEDAARAVVSATAGRSRNLLSCWLGGEAADRGRRILSAAGIATYDTPDSAVRAFLHMVQYRRNQEMLMEVPQSTPSGFVPAKATARLVIENALLSDRSIMTEPEAKAVLSAYGIPIVETRIAASPDAAVTVAKEVGYPVALKILSPDITHKSDVGGVVLDLEGPEELKAAAEAMRARLTSLVPDAKLLGYSVQAMARRPRAHELIVGMTTDPIFGPVILFGQGGTAVEVIADKSIGLPPLNMHLAELLIQKTRVSRLLAGYRNRPAADLDAVKLTLVQISQLIVDIPEVVEVDINPLFADDEGVLALDARIRVEHATTAGPYRLAIRPYPTELEETIRLRDDRRLLLRPIRPEDEPAHHRFISRLTPEDIHFRFFGAIKEIPHSEMARLTQIDYDREMAFIATTLPKDGPPETLGVVRIGTDPDNETAEFAIIVRSDYKGHGLGRALLQKIIRYCRDRKTRRVVGQVLFENEEMLGLATALGFEKKLLAEDHIYELTLALS